MRKKLLILALLTTAVSATSTFADPISTPDAISDTPIIGIGSGNNAFNNISCEASDLTDNKIIDLTRATSDYMLQPGETAVITFNNSSGTIPLHIAVPEPSSPTQPVIYEITMTLYYSPDFGTEVFFRPNNTANAGQFENFIVEHGNWNWILMRSIDGVWYRGLPSDSSDFDSHAGYDPNYESDTSPYVGTIKIVYFGAKYPKHIIGETYSNLSMSLTSSIWNNTTTPWTSLGTLVWKIGISGQITIKRIS
ncbi:MAG: hypothetical protein JHC33_15175 [Ignisphaera sp.]|nr:hypothetical protein [Ignisphaera sp.]